MHQAAAAEACSASSSHNSSQHSAGQGLAAIAAKFNSSLAQISLSQPFNPHQSANSASYKGGAQAYYHQSASYSPIKNECFVPEQSSQHYGGLHGNNFKKSSNDFYPSHSASISEFAPKSNGWTAEFQVMSTSANPFEFSQISSN